MPPKKISDSKPEKLRYLQGENLVKLYAFIGVNLAVFFTLLVGDDFSLPVIDQFWHHVTAKDGILAVIVPILATVLSGVFSDTWKARLVFWRWHYPLPGCRVFSELLVNDDRPDKEALAKKLGEYPKSPGKQNELWFSLYKKHANIKEVLEAHKIYLLTRDMASISLLFVILLPLIVFAENLNWRVAAIYAALLLMQYVLIAISCRNYGNRFVLNVLVVESRA